MARRKNKTESHGSLDHAHDADSANTAHPKQGDLQKTPRDEKRDDLKVGAQPTSAPDPPKTQVVGIGASAGGLQALKQFFSGFKAPTGMAFVVVVHLHPEYESHMQELLQPLTSMRVTQVNEAVSLEPDTIYIIPPASNLTAIDSHLRPTQMDALTRRAPIDHFFRTLADCHEGNVVGVILSGTGSDGTLGLRLIKEQGGLTIAQDPEEAQFDGMPRSAIAAGFVDLVLPIADMPDQIIEFARTRPLVQIPPEDQSLPQHGFNVLHKIFALLRSRIGQDFSDYKPSTVLRRIRRRMQLHRIEEMGDYLAFLTNDREEIKLLFDDLLITVTEFFRDPETFDYLGKSVIPQIIEGKTRDDTIRVWSAGCSTGEEAYSLAILLLENTTGMESPPKIQIFATDLHQKSLTRAREGIYPETIEANVSPARLNRFFTKTSGAYEIRKEVRELIVFAPHNLLMDPPFSHMDLICCRNVLIYIQRDVQRDVIALFHYALHPNGWLLLGSSETVERADLFTTEDKRHAVFRRRNVVVRDAHIPRFAMGARRRDESDALRSTPALRSSRGAAHMIMVEQYAPPSVLINDDFEILHNSAHAWRYLQVPGGEPTNNLLLSVREPLRIELTSALHAVKANRKPYRSKPITLKMDDHESRVVIRVLPGSEPDLQGVQLVIFDEIEEVEGQTSPSPPTEFQATTLRDLETELEVTRTRLGAVILEFEATKEEMQVSNEELQSSNEELRSTLEELETSKEELQSMNEELTTLNQENRHRVEELGQLSSDMQNLLMATEIATLFLDRELRILNFTPRVGELFNIRQNDRGRPLSDLTHRLGYPDLLEDAQKTLQKLTTIEREVPSENNRWYLTRTLPYRTPGDRIDGVVLTFVDITDRKMAEEKLRQIEARYREGLEVKVNERTAELEAQTRRLRALAVELGSVEKRDRRRLASMLHDELQQLLVACKMQINQLRQKSGSAEDGTDYDLLLKWVDEAITATRQLTYQISPPALSEPTLMPVLRWLSKEMRERYNMNVVILGNETIEIAEDTKGFLFECVRELLFNSVKHSGVLEAAVRVAVNSDRIELTVSDKGRGFDMKEKSHAGSFGLFSIRERLAAVGGTIDIKTSPGHGFSAEIRIPLKVSV